MINFNNYLATSQDKNFETVDFDFKLLQLDQLELCAESFIENFHTNTRSQRQMMKIFHKFYAVHPQFKDILAKKLEELILKSGIDCRLESLLHELFKADFIGAMKVYEILNNFALKEHLMPLIHYFRKISQTLQEKNNDLYLILLNLFYEFSSKTNGYNREKINEFLNEFYECIPNVVDGNSRNVYPSVKWMVNLLTQNKGGNKVVKFQRFLR